MSKEIVRTDQAPEAIGPYSQATEFENTIYVSGQIPIDPNSGDILSGSIREQTKLVLKNVRSILRESGYSLEDVMKAEVFMDDMNEFSDLNDVYGDFFNEDPPARACVEVSQLPKDVKVEITVVAKK